MEEEQCSNHQGAHNIQERQFIDNIGEENVVIIGFIVLHRNGIIKVH